MYLNYVTDQANIAALQQDYPFLSSTALSLVPGTLEGFLYPDTYNIDKNKEIVPQLVRKQLDGFATRVRKNISAPTDFYKTMILASVLEKEERNTSNKATVAGIFLKRLEI